jgi:small-conductance mechanosensitive channel
MIKEFFAELAEISQIPFIEHWAPMAIVIAFYFGFRKIAHIMASRKKEGGGYSHYKQQMIELSLAILLILLLILSSPLQDSLKEGLLSLVGIVASAAIALSSTTLMGNLMGGFMLRGIDSFKVGDFVRIKGQLGKVADIGLLHIEIQTEESDMLTVPNLSLAKDSFTVIRSEGTVIQVEVSLGYDIHHKAVEAALLSAVERAGMEEGYVQIKTLNDFSVTYGLYAKLDETKKLLTATARLNAAMLDSLHQADIEIISPSFMNQRNITDREAFMAKPRAAHKDDDENTIEAILFNKADQAEVIKRLERRLKLIAKKVSEFEKQLSGANKEEREELEIKHEAWKRREAQAQFLLDEAKDDS